MHHYGFSKPATFVPGSKCSQKAPASERLLELKVGLQLLLRMGSSLPERRPQTQQQRRLGVTCSNPEFPVTLPAASGLRKSDSSRLLQKKPARVVSFRKQDPVLNYMQPPVQIPNYNPSRCLEPAVCCKAE